MSKEQLLRQFIRESAARIGGLGPRNIFTLDDSSFTFEDYHGYDVDVAPDVNGTYALTIYYKDDKMGYTTRYHSHDEAVHQARMIIDKHRVSKHADE